MRRVRLIDELARVRPEVTDADAAIAQGRVEVDGSVVANARSLVRPGCAIVVRAPAALRGSVKLRAALDAFGIDVAGRVALDVGAATGGFTTVLLERGASKVYAVDAGHGQLLGSLRQDPRVVNLEATNVGELTADLVADRIGIVTVDVSYLSLREAVAQVAAVGLEPEAELVGLVKPMFELSLATAPTDRRALDEAIRRAGAGVEAAGWDVVSTAESAVRGAGGAIEGWINARNVA